MGGRVYAPVIGRFMSPDPFIADAFDSQSLNRYSYVRNNPLSRVDPSGFIDDCVICIDVDFGEGTSTPQWPGYLLPPGVTSLSFRWPASVPRESGVEPAQLAPQFVEFDEATMRRAAQAGLPPAPGVGPGEHEIARAAIIASRDPRAAAVAVGAGAFVVGVSLGSGLLIRGPWSHMERPVVMAEQVRRPPGYVVPGEQSTQAIRISSILVTRRTR